MRSRRQSNTSLPDPVFFLDRNLGAEYLPTALRNAGFRVIVHDDHFRGRQDVGDPEVIEECGRHGWFLLTADSDMSRRWRKEIDTAKIGVFCQTNNHQGPRIWAPKIVKAKTHLVKATRKWERPFIGFITAEATPSLRKKS